MNKKLATRLAAGLGVVFAAVAVMHGTGVKINRTTSMPLGFYVEADEPVLPGAVVYVCPPDRPVFDVALERGYIGPGACQGKYAHLIKVVAAVGGAQLHTNSDGVHVDGVLLHNSQPLARDAKGRVMAAFEAKSETLAPSDVLLLTESPVGFDSRYFGPLPGSAIVTVLKPLFTW